VLAIVRRKGAASVIGRVRGESLAIGIEGEDAIDLPVEALRRAWSGALEKHLTAGAANAKKR
jgi:hypothetical protein